MTTQINVIVDNGGLSAKAKQRTQANRWQKLESDNRQKVEATGTQQRDANRLLSGIGADGRPLYGTPPAQPLRRDEPAAFRRSVGTFGFIDINGCNTGENADPYFKEKYQIDTQKPLRGYKVIRIVIGGSADACVGRGEEPSQFFAGKTAQLAQFVTAGGVLWINNEYSGCGIDALTLNQYLSTAFGATIGFVDNIQPEGQREYFGPFAGYGVVRSQLAYAAQANTAPPFFYNAATCSISGGTVYYSSANGVTCAFEKIGQGFLVLSGDQNGTGQFPSYTEGDKNFVEALLALK